MSLTQRASDSIITISKLTKAQYALASSYRFGVYRQYWLGCGCHIRFYLLGVTYGWLEHN